jgi:hypothetical protein
LPVLEESLLSYVQWILKVIKDNLIEKQENGGIEMKIGPNSIIMGL